MWSLGSGPCAFIPAVILIFAWPKDMLTFAKVPFKALDYVGTVLMLGCTVLLVFIVNQAAIEEFAWNSGPTISVLTISGLCWIAMVLWQREVFQNRRFRHIRPQFPWQVLTDRVMMCVLATSVSTGSVLFLAVVHIPMRAQIVNVYDAVKAGILLLPLMASMATGSMVGGALSAKQNNTYWTLNSASILILVGSGLLSTLGETLSPETKQWGFEGILGFGLGLNMVSATFITSLQVQFEYHGKTVFLLTSLGHAPFIFSANRPDSSRQSRYSRSDACFRREHGCCLWLHCPEQGNPRQSQRSAQRRATGRLLQVARRHLQVHNISAVASETGIYRGLQYQYASMHWAVGPWSCSVSLRVPAQSSIDREALGGSGEGLCADRGPGCGAGTIERGSGSPDRSQLVHLSLQFVDALCLAQRTADSGTKPAQHSRELFVWKQGTGACLHAIALIHHCARTCGLSGPYESFLEAFHDHRRSPGI